MHFVYRRVLICCGLLPLLVLTAPVVFIAYLGMWNWLSGGYAGMTHIGSLGIGVALYHVIQSLATSHESFQRALQANRQYIPLVMIVCALLLNVSAPLLGLSAFSGPLGWILSAGQSLRMALVLLLLGVAVLARFIGPQSIGTYIIAMNLYLFSNIILI